MSLADQIINHGPYASGDWNPFHRIIAAAELDALRDELLELRQARAILVKLTDPDPCHFDHHGDCQAHFAGTVDGRCAQAAAQELARRADAHTEDCR